jgi:hypothetical protein
VLDALAAGFLKLGPEKAVSELAALEREAATFGWSDGYDRGFLYYRLARTVSDPLLWLTSALTAHLPPGCTPPFLAAATRPRSEAGDEALVRIFGSDDYREYVPLAVEAVLSMSEPSGGLLRSALAKLEVNGHNTTFLLRHCAPSVFVMRELLRHSNPNVRVHAAFAEWLLEPEGTIRSVVTDDWRAAIVAARNEYEFVLAKILTSDELLAPK